MVELLHTFISNNYSFPKKSISFTDVQTYTEILTITQKLFFRIKFKRIAKKENSKTVKIFLEPKMIAYI